MNIYMYIVIAIVVLIVLGEILYVGYPIYAAIQEGKILMAEAVPYEQHPQSLASASTTASSSIQQILVTGDSTAVGTGAKDNKNSTGGRLGAVYPNAELTNVSENGLKLYGLVSKLNALPTNSHYDLVLIQIGANDVVRFTPLTQVQSELDTVLNWASIHSTHTIVLTAGDIGLSPVFKFPLNIFVEQRTLKVRKIYMQEIAKYPSISYVDLFKYRQDEPFNTNVPLYYAPDHFHPSDAGYGLWFQSVQAKLPAE
jgi:lysophospholipase L1-like esterase